MNEIPIDDAMINILHLEEPKEGIKLFECFAGYGGASWGLKLANIPFKCVGYSEIKKTAIACYSNNFPSVKNFGDITKIDWKQVPNFDLLTGGFPCQDISSAGKQDLSKGRSILINELIRCLREKQPKYFLFENVSALNQEKFRPFLREIRNDLHKQGYQVFYNTLNSLEHGTPQNRLRVWFIGFRNDLAKPFGWNPYPNPSELRKTFQECKDIEQNYKKVNKTPSRDEMKVKCKNITNANHIGTLTLKQDRFPNAGIIDYQDYYRFITLREAFRCQGFFNDEINLEGLSNNQALDLAGDGWDINLVSQLFEKMLRDFEE